MRRPCDMNHVCRSKHGTTLFPGTHLEIASSSSASGLGGLGIVIAASIVGMCMCVNLPVTTYLPKGMEGRLRCPQDANPPLTFIIWKKDETIVESDVRVAIDDQGTLVISSVIASDEGNYTCTPYSPLWNGFSKYSLRIIVKDLPSFIVRPLPVYQRRVGQTVIMPCVADGDPKPVISWQKADGDFPPSTKTLQDGGSLKIVQLSEEEQGTYECIARNVVTSIITTTLLIVQLAMHSSPYNVTVEVTESTARVSWLPPYIEEGQHYEYELWCQSQDGDANIWQRFDAIPDNVTTVTVYNLQPKTKYRFKIMSNYSGRPHFSREMLVKTKPKEMPFPDDDEDIDSGDSSGSTSLPDRTIVPSTAGYHRPMPPFNVTVRQLRSNNSVNISWLASRRSPVPVHYFIVQYRTFGQWMPLSGRIDAAQTHYEWKVPSLGTTYYFQVLSYGHDHSHSKPSSTVVFKRPDPLTESAHVSGGTVGGLIGGITFFVVLIALLLVAFKLYKIRAKKKRETSLASTEYASTSINRTLEGRASPILETLSIISNHSQIRNNDHEMRQCHETPI